MGGNGTGYSSTRLDVIGIIKKQIKWIIEHITNINIVIDTKIDKVSSGRGNIAEITTDGGIQSSGITPEQINNAFGEIETINETLDTKIDKVLGVESKLPFFNNEGNIEASKIIYHQSGEVDTGGMISNLYMENYGDYQRAGINYSHTKTENSYIRRIGIFDDNDGAYTNSLLFQHVNQVTPNLESSSGILNIGGGCNLLSKKLTMEIVTKRLCVPYFLVAENG